MNNQTYEDVYNTIEENEFYTIEKVFWDEVDKNHLFVQKGEAFKYVDVYLDDLYKDNYILKLDNEINKFLKSTMKLYTIDNVMISGFDWEIPLNIEVVFQEIGTFNLLSITTHLKRDEYKKIEKLDMKILRLKMFDVTDIDFSAFKNLEKCYIVLHKEHSKKDEINNSKKYIERLIKSYSKIEFNFSID